MSWWDPSSWGNAVDRAESYIPFGPYLQQLNRMTGLVQSGPKSNSVDDLVNQMRNNQTNSPVVPQTTNMSGVDLLNKLYQEQQAAQNPQPGGQNPQNPSGTLATSPLQQLMQSLYQGLGTAGQPSLLSPDQIKRQAQAQAAAQYDPQIQAIIANMNSTKSRTAANQKTIGSMYNQLAGLTGGEVKESQANTKAAKASEASALKELQKGLGAQYADQQAQQAQELGKLGLGDILGSTTANQKADMQFLQGVNNTDSAAQQRALDLMGNADTSFYNEGGQIARTEGSENIADLTQQLNDYLNQQSSSKAGLEGQKSAAIQQLINQMTTGQQDAQAKFDTERWNRALQLAQFQNQLQNQGGAGKTPTTGLLGAQAIANQLGGGNPQYLSTNMSNLMNLLQQPDFLGNQFVSPVSNQFVGMNPQQAVKEARAYSQAQSLDANQSDALVKMILAYMGKLQ